MTKALYILGMILFPLSGMVALLLDGWVWNLVFAVCSTFFVAMHFVDVQSDVTDEEE